VKAQLSAKLQGGRPVQLSAEEAAALVEALRQAVATTLELPLAELGDDARVFDDLGLDSIDVFDVLDQLAEQFEVQVALEELPETVLRGGASATFRDFAEGLLRYFRAPPAPGA
jgi:acyl carrier protein